MSLRFFIFILIFQNQILNSQEGNDLNWWSPLDQEFQVVEGQVWFKNLESGFDRLPLEAKEKVRKPLWNLSKNSAGLSIRFISNASEISVKYKLKGSLSMPHMPSTGVSGLDLYAKNSDGQWLWIKGNYSIGEHSTYHYVKLKPNDDYHTKGREYKLILPLYNSVDSLKMGVSKEAFFTPLPIRKEKPIVVYGTSIAQGACASRPGMAWTSILERKMDRPLINLGFSGNGRLEEEVIDFVAEINAKVYILDCLPNLATNENRTLSDVKHRILSSVHLLKNKNPEIPILLVEHAGYSDEMIHLNRKREVSDLNKIMKEAYSQLLSEGIKNIYLLTKEEINLTKDSTVDGTHPNDLGMQYYANAYEKVLRSVFKEPMGAISTTKPVTQDRDADVYNWNLRHQSILESNNKKTPKICFIGNSIVHQWGGIPDMPIANGANSWNRNFEALGVKNFGCGWDRIENVLWRVYHGELDGFDAEQIILKIGTNNLHLNTDDEIIKGLHFLVDAIKERQPKAKITLIGILPRRDYEERVRVLNLEIHKATQALDVNYVSIGDALLTPDAKIDETLFRDGLHPNANGYNIIAPLISSYLRSN